MNLLDPLIAHFPEWLSGTWVGSSWVTSSGVSLEPIDTSFGLADKLIVTVTLDSGYQYNTVNMYIYGTDGDFGVYPSSPGDIFEYEIDTSGIGEITRIDIYNDTYNDMVVSQLSTVDPAASIFWTNFARQTETE